MTDRSSRFERNLPALFDELAGPRTPDYLEAAIERASSRAQRPVWTFPERWLPMDLSTQLVPAPGLPWRRLGVLALIALVLATTVAIHVGSLQQRLPAPFGLADNGRIAVSVDGDVHTIDPATGASTPIVTGPGEDVRVAVSPTGTHLVFEREQVNDGATSYELVVTDIDGAAPRVVVPGRPDGFDAFAWSPDGRAILVDLADRAGIWLYDATGATAPRQIVELGSAYEAPFRPPDGSAILVQREDAAGRTMLSIDLATGRETLLAEGGIGGDDLNDARWSPDGSSVVFHMAPRGDSASQRLFIVGADGGSARQVTNAPGTWWDIDPTWSPTGDQIAFDRYERVGPDWFVRRLAILDVASGSVREIGPLAVEARAAAPSPADPGNPEEGMWLEWAPDGTAILAVPTEAIAHPVLIDVATGDWRNLDPLVAPDFVTQAWQRVASPD
jgi:Tol biopolymer transport system component